MALNRSDRNIVVATHSNIGGFSVDIPGKRISVVMKYGNMVDGKFVVAGEKTHIIADKPLALSAVDRNETVVDGRVVLPYTPVADLSVSGLSGQVYFEGQDYSRSGNILNMITIANGSQVKTSYYYHTPATIDFSSIAAGAVDGGKNLYDNIKDALWGKLLELGLEAGTVE